MTSRSLRTLPPFGRRRGMLDGSVRRRSTPGAGETALEGSDRQPGLEHATTQRPETQSDHCADDIS